jgi:hypothetical protein
MSLANVQHDRKLTAVKLRGQGAKSLAAISGVSAAQYGPLHG